MSDESKQQASSEFEQITPTKIAITPQLSDSNQTPPDKAASSERRIWIIACGAVSAVLVLLVFLVLPRIVSKPDVVIEAPATESVPVAQVSPWKEAQQAKARKEAQDILAQLLDEQFNLEEAKVSLWAADEFAQATALAEQGDEHYREQLFEEAITKYQEALTLVKTLSANVETVVTDKVAEGYAQIVAGDGNAAKALFDLVLQIEPFNAEAEKGLQRVATLDEVLSLSEQAELEEKTNNYDQAKLLLEQALVLDAEATGLADRLAKIKGKILERDFGSAMSQGYAALEQSNYAGARKSFRQALALKPKAEEAQAGLEQVTHQITQNKIAEYRKQASDLMMQEQWQAARQKYQALLKLDPSLKFAQKGRKQTADRARLDELLVEQISQPERLSSDEVFNEVKTLLSVAATVRDPGERLRGQISQLNNMVRAARTPIKVDISSDNQTKVILYKTGSLGNFAHHQLSLLPGKYVLVGKRQGYRDVRKEFKVSAAQPALSINIQCTEKI